MKRPNILLIVMDTARAQQFSCYGYEHETTPTVDRLAGEGTVFGNAIATSPWTLPSHASIFTGTYPSRHGAHASHMYLDPEYRTLAEVLSRAGYQTLGLSNNFWLSETFGMHRGFGRFLKTWQVIQASTDTTRINEILKSTRGLKRLTELFKAMQEGNFWVNSINGIYGKFLFKRYDDGARRTNGIIRKWLQADWDRQGPFFIFVNYFEPHLKYWPPKEFRTRFLTGDPARIRRVNQNPWRYISGVVDMSEEDFDVLRALYDGEICYLDMRIRETVNLLESMGILDDTVIIITSDHGDNIGEHGLMDHQYNLYDTVLRVPLVVRFPGEFEKGKRDQRQVQLVDLLPTLLDLLELWDEELREQIQGRSLLERWEDRFAVSEYISPIPTMEALKRRVPESTDVIYKYNRGLCSIRTQRFKLIHATDGNHEFYDLRQDPDELNNRYAESPEELRPLEELLTRWLASFRAKEKREAPELDEDIKKRLEGLGYLL